MSAQRSNERELLAAEYALGVLEREERERAQALAGSNPDFAALVDRWNEHLSPMLAEIGEVQADPRLWESINRRLDSEGGRGSNVVALERRLRLWRGYAGAATAAAAALLLVIGLDGSRQQPPVSQATARQPMLVANVAAEDRSASFVIAFDRDRERLLVTPAVTSPAPGHDHELWVIPASGTPRSLGLVASGLPHALPVPAALLPELHSDATIAVSVEPVGGSPTGQPTGPVVATGKMSLI